MSAVVILGVVFGLGAVALGVRMILRPVAYLGTGIQPARDPRTVRFFGIVLAAIGAAVLVLNLVKLASE